MQITLRHVNIVSRYCTGNPRNWAIRVLPGIFGQYAYYPFQSGNTRIARINLVDITMIAQSHLSGNLGKLISEELFKPWYIGIKKPQKILTTLICIITAAG